MKAWERVVEQTIKELNQKHLHLREALLTEKKDVNALANIAKEYDKVTLELVDLINEVRAKQYNDKDKDAEQLIPFSVTFTDGCRRVLWGQISIRH